MTKAGSLWVAKKAENRFAPEKLKRFSPKRGRKLIKLLCPDKDSQSLFPVFQHFSKSFLPGHAVERSPTLREWDTPVPQRWSGGDRPERSGWTGVSTSRQDAPFSMNIHLLTSSPKYAQSIYFPFDRFSISRKRSRSGLSKIPPVGEERRELFLPVQVVERCPR